MLHFLSEYLLRITVENSIKVCIILVWHVGNVARNNGFLRLNIFHNSNTFQLSDSIRDCLEDYISFE